MLQVYNTLTRKKEKFESLQKGKVKMYACGVTVYDYCHLGHARSLITFDLIHRYLKYLDFHVTFVRNFTDIDDKIINRANEQGIDYKKLTEKFIHAFYEDVDALKMERPTIEPKATEHILEMIALIQGLEEKGLAYKAGGDVYYSVRAFQSYGKLSGKNIDELESGARVDVLESKKDPLDFTLWKGAKPNEPKWDSPWGEGRPGWHLECSVMSMHYLGETFDIHGGGRDLIFPHHENEIAQSEGCTQKLFAKYWLHNGFVNIDAEKMSKSLGNFLTLRDLLKTYTAEEIRLFILSSHYRSPLDYTEKNMQNAVSSLERYYQTKKRLEDSLVEMKGKDCDPDLFKQVKSLKGQFQEAMDDDFNTAKVVGIVFELVRNFNKALDENKPISPPCLKVFFETVSDIGSVTGLFGSTAEKYFLEKKTRGLSQKTLSEEEILAAIAKRKEARQNRDFAKADQIRKDLFEKGVELKDNPDGSTDWTVQ